MQPPADPNRLMREAEAHFVAGRHGDARRLTEQLLRVVPGHPAVLHLHGLILSRIGELAPARAALEAAHRGLPGDPQIANNLGNLMSRLGEHETALAAYEAAIRLDPGFGAARLQRAVTLDELGRYDEARAELARIAPPTADTLVALASVDRNSGDLGAAAARLDGALGLDPAHAVALSGRARIALDIGEPDAGARYRAAIAARPDRRELLLGYVAAAETAAARAEALDRVRAALAVDPGWPEGHRELSAALWEDGHREAHASSYEAALAARPRDAVLWRDYVAAFGKVDDHAAAAAVCARAEAATGDHAFAAAAFAYLGAAGETSAAEAVLARLAEGTVPPIALAKHRLLKRDIAAAERFLAAATDADPDDIEAWALRGIAWTLLEDPRSEWLNGQPGLLGVHELPLSPADITAVASRLRAVHLRSTLRVGQSVRGGTQTAGNIFDRLEPEIVLIRDVLRAAVERHRGGMPPADPAHPVLRHRDAALRFAGSWSIRLVDGGFHVQHIHPKGVLSAASYWTVPEPSAGEPQAGWLEIGGAPAYLKLDLPARCLVEPKPGRLVLFPSTLHHGTRPFPAGERMSVAFDVAAAGMSA